MRGQNKNILFEKTRAPRSNTKIIQIENKPRRISPLKGWTRPETEFDIEEVDLSLVAVYKKPDGSSATIEEVLNKVKNDPREKERVLRELQQISDSLVYLTRHGDSHAQDCAKIALEYLNEALIKGLRDLSV